MFVFSHSMIAEKVIDWKYAKAHMKAAQQTAYDDYKNIFIHLHLLSIIYILLNIFSLFFRSYISGSQNKMINIVMNNLPKEGIM